MDDSSVLNARSLSAGRLGPVNWLVGLTLYIGRRWGECLNENDGAHFQCGRAAVAASLLLGEAELNRLAPL